MFTVLAVEKEEAETTVGDKDKHCQQVTLDNPWNCFFVSLQFCKVVVSLAWPASFTVPGERVWSSAIGLPVLAPHDNWG